MEDYYTKNAKAYEEETRNADRSSVYSFLRPYLPKGKLSVLDVGFGSGRDRLYFKSLGYDVEGIDTSLPFVIDAKKKDLPVIRQTGWNLCHPIPMTLSMLLLPCII